MRQKTAGGRLMMHSCDSSLCGMMLRNQNVLNLRLTWDLRRWSSASRTVFVSPAPTSLSDELARQSHPSRYNVLTSKRMFSCHYRRWISWQYFFHATELSWLLFFETGPFNHLSFTFGIPTVYLSSYLKNVFMLQCVTTDSGLVGGVHCVCLS